MEIILRRINYKTVIKHLPPRPSLFYFFDAAAGGFIIFAISTPEL